MSITSRGRLLLTRTEPSDVNPDGAPAGAPTVVDYRDIVESLDDAVCRWRADTTLTYCNARYRRMFGVCREDGDGRKWMDFIPAAERPVLAGIVDGLLRNPRTLTYEHVVTAADGSSRWISWTDAPLRDATGNLIGFQSVGRDVTERRVAEQELAEKTERLAEAQRVARIGSWELDLAGQRLKWSDEVFRIFELDRARFDPSYEAFLAAVHPEDRERVNAAYSASVRDRKPYELVHRLQMTDGRVKWVRERCETFYDDAGRAVRSVGTVQDVTDRIDVERELEASRAYLRAIIESEPECVKLLDRDGNLLDMNPAGLAMIEADSLEQVRGRCVCPLVAPLDRRDFDAMIAAVFAGDSRQLSFEITGLKGGRRYLETHSVPLWDEQRRSVKAVLGVTRDVTERRRAEKALRASEARLSFLLGASPVVIYTCEAHGDFAATYVSPNIEELFGYTPRQWLSQPGFWMANIHPEDAPRVFAELENLFRHDRHQHEYRFRFPDGSYRWVHDSLRLVRDAAGAPVEIIGYWADVDGRRRAEEELKQHRERLEDLVRERTHHLQAAKNEAERANRAKSEFLSRMSHELRTPMNAILGFAQVLQMQSLDTRHRLFVDEIHRAGEHLLRLIDDLLDISRIEAGKVAVEVRPTLLHAVVADALRIVQPLVAQRKLSLRAMCQADDLHVLADAGRLRQILVNLLSNAVKYNRDGGTIAFGCRPAGADRVRLLVADTGRGIDPQRMPKLFEPFERLGAESTAVEGTGIGLAVSKQLANLMGADIGVESTPGVGSTFWIDLPAAEAPTPDAEDARGPHADAVAAATVLYVEDNPANLRVVEAAFGQRAGLRMISAVDGERGLQTASRERPDVIVLDIHLPGLDGYAVLAALKDDAELRATPVIALSADAMPDDIARGLRAGFDEYLTKPVRVDELLAAIDAALRRTRPANA